MTFCGLRFAVSHEKPDAKRSLISGVIQRLGLLPANKILAGFRQCLAGFLEGDLIRSTKFLDRQCGRRSPKVSGGMLKTNYESNACLLLETDLRWLLWRLGLLGRALKSGPWPVIDSRRRISQPQPSK